MPRSTTATTQRTPRWPLAIIVTVLVSINVAGLPYYLAPMAERVRSPLHPWLRPSGVIGQSAGILALAIFLFLWLYPLRKRVRWLAFTGSIGRWLDVHITVALALPLLLAIHAAWRFGGLIGLGFDAMMIVVASGIVGRYLYVRIPRSRSGVELTLGEVRQQRERLIGDLLERTKLPRAELERLLEPARPTEAAPGIVRALLSMLQGDIARWRAGRALRRRWRSDPALAALDAGMLRDAARLATRGMALEQQVRMLDATHRVFRFWHVAHRPMAFTALVAVVIHVAVVVALGATWLW